MVRLNSTEPVEKPASRIVLSIVVYLILTGVLAVALYLLYQNLPGEPEGFKIADYDEGGVEMQEINSTDKVIQFYPNMRFNHNEISYFIDPECSDKKEERILRAFSILHEKVKLISFKSDIGGINADILVSCSETQVEKEAGKFVAGEGGPTKIINTSGSNLIVEGKVLLYRTSECDYPVVELHELLHVFGFDHINYSSDIMHPIYDCGQRINQETINTLVYLYSLENLADLYFEDVDAVKHGRYVDFNFKVVNKGWVEIKNVSLAVYSNDKKIKTFELGDIGVGMGRVFEVSNLKLASRNADNIKFVIESDEKEIDEKNNIIELNI